MFGNAYQNGPSLEVWDARVDPSKNQFYRQLSATNAHNPRNFDKEVKSYLYSLQSSNSKMNLPADDSKSLSLHQQYLILQIFIPIGFHWWIQLAIIDISGMRRRINLTTVPGKQQAKYFSYRYPIEVTRGSWLFLAIDLYSFMEAFKGQTFRALDHLTIGSHCKLRRIFTMKQFVQYEIPKNYWLAHQLPQTLELISFKHQEKEKGKEICLDLLTQSIISREAYVKSSQIKKKETNKLIPADQKSPKSKWHNRSRNNSQVIIEKAKRRLQSLEKEEQLLLKQQQDLQQIHPYRLHNKKKELKQRSKEQSSQQLSAVKANDSEKKSLDTKMKSPKNRTKVPLLQRSFKEDEALIAVRGQFWAPSARRQSEVSVGLGAFPSTIITRKNEKQIRGGVNRKQLQLIYDQMVGCYYHPQTNSYYQLRR